MIVSSKYATATIVERKDHAPGLWSIKLKPDVELAFKPGQYVAFGVEVGDDVLERAFSIVSSPAEPELEFFIELVPHGELSPRLFERKVGDVLLMRKKAKGIFVLDEKSGHPNHYLVSTVTGIAPFVSMVRTRQRAFKEGRLTDGHRLYCLQGAARSEEFAYREELEAAARDLPGFSYVGTVSRPWEDPAWAGERGRVDDVVRKYSDQLGLTPESTTAYLCGHPEMIVHAKGILKRRGFEDGAIRQENYWVQTAGD
jgi:ferredoxin--NADP+ reductase